MTTRNFENVLQGLHSKFIKQDASEAARNNRILGEVVEQVVNEMKKDTFFGQYFNRIFYGGSYYDGLKVGRPEAFDLYLLLKIPQSGIPELQESDDEPGYLRMMFCNIAALSEQFKHKFLVDGCDLSAKKVRQWMKSVYSKALNKFGSEREGCTFKLSDRYIRGTRSEDGPALILQVHFEQTTIKIHFVPGFEFTNDQWPSASYDRPSLFQNRKTFFIVPKSPPSAYECTAGAYWRPSFQEQERALLHDERNLKPTIKLLKRLRDKQQHGEVTSYCIKTIFLWEHMENGDSYWNGSMTNVFFKMLDRYIVYIQSGHIRDFWNPEHNLLDISVKRKDTIVNRLRNVQRDLKSNYETEPSIICRYLGYSTSWVEPVAPVVRTRGASVHEFDSFHTAPSGYSWTEEPGITLSPTRNAPDYGFGSNSFHTAQSAASGSNTSTATSTGLSGFAKLAIGVGIGLAAIAGAAAFAGSESSSKKTNKDSK